MALSLVGSLETVTGSTTGSYIRVEYVKIKPWEGIIEYNPMLYRSKLDAEMSKIRYYGDTLPVSTFPIPLISMSLENNNKDQRIYFSDLMYLELTGSLQEMTINHYSQSLLSESIQVLNFNEDGEEVISEDFRYWEELTVYSQSVEEHNPIDLSKADNALEECYKHLRGVLETQIPSSNIIDC